MLRIIIAIVISLTVFICCKKAKSLEPEALPPALSKVYTDTTDCGYCPFNISHIVYLGKDYYKLSPEQYSNSVIICDYIAGAVIYDTEGRMVEINSELYTGILNLGSDHGIIYSCRK